MEKIKLSYSDDNTVARIILDDGKGNILDQVMMSELQEVLDSFKSEPQLKLITFEGAGKNFSFGASVEEHTRENAAQMLQSFHALFHSIVDLQIPTLAKVKGQCLGGGMELVLVCNFIIADLTAVFAQPEIVLGVFPPPASIILPLKVGTTWAEELLITGRPIKAEEAMDIGLVNAVIADGEDMDEKVGHWVGRNILGKSASSLRYAVNAARGVFNKTLIDQLAILEKLYVEELMETADANEGITSFIEKRKPVWKNN